MSWLYSQALVEEYLGDISLDGEQSVQLSGSNTQLAYCALDKMTGFSRLSRFGMMYKPLTENLGAELLMLYLEAFPAKTLVPQEKEKASQDQEAQCGNTWQGLLAKFDPNTSLWKTAQCSLFEDLELSLETFPRWGSMRNGELFQREILVLPILENESGLLQQMWATPTCMESLPPMISKSYKESQTGRRKISSNLRDQVHQITQMWPTPVAKESNGSQAFKLTDAVEATMGKSMPVMQKNVEKWKEFQMWPTPVCQDSRHATTRHLDPNNQYWKSNLGEVVMSTEQTGIPGRLNPTWVEWLMGWPLGWTDLKPLEMDKFQEWQQQHGES